MKPVKSIDKKKVAEKDRGEFLWEKTKKAWGVFNSESFKKLMSSE